GEPRLAKLAENEWTEAARIADGVKLVLGQHDKGIGAFHLIESVTKCAGEIAGLRAREEVHDDFGIAIGLEDGAFVLELASPLGGIGQVAVVTESDFSFVAVDDDGLSVEQAFIAGSGIARVTDC